MMAFSWNDVIEGKRSLCPSVKWQVSLNSHLAKGKEGPCASEWGGAEMFLCSDMRIRGLNYRLAQAKGRESLMCTCCEFIRVNWQRFLGAYPLL